MSETLDEHNSVTEPGEHVQATVRWVTSKHDAYGNSAEMKLIVGKLMERRKQRCVATVSVLWALEIVTWRTWDKNGVASATVEVEDAISIEEAIQRAKAFATLAAVEQGFI